MDKSERYLKEIAKNTADIVKELKKINSRKEESSLKIKAMNLTEAQRRDLTEWHDGLK